MSKTIICKVCGKSKAAAGSKSTTCFDCYRAGYKYCGSCKQIKKLTDFQSNKAKHDGLCCRCRDCENADSASRRVLRYNSDEAYATRIREQSRIEHANRTPAEKEHYNELRRIAYADDEDKRILASIRWHERNRDSNGSFTHEEWQDCLIAYNYECAYCGEKHNLTVDHIVAVSKGGYNYAFNLVPACAHCNGSKGAKDVVEWYSAQPFYDEDKLRNIHKRYRLKQEELLRQEE